MKLKSLVIVIAVLAALSAAVYFVQRPATAVAADARVGQPLATRAVIEPSAKVRLSDQGKVVNLVRQGDGTWRVASYFDLPADFTKLAGLTASLTEAKLQRFVTTSPERIARLEFKDTKIEFLDAADKALWSVTLGKNAEAGGGRYVRFGTEDKAFLANLTLWLDVEAKNWADSQILNVKPEDIAKVEIPFAEGGPVAVSRAKKDDVWTADKVPAGQRVKADRIATVLSAIASVRFSDTVDPTDAGIAAAKANERVFKFTTFGGQTYTVAMGRKPEEKKLKAPAQAAQLRPATAGTNPGPAAAGNGTASPAPAAEDKVEAPKPADTTPPADAKKPEEAKPAAPEYETIPAGPVFVFIASSDSAAPVNAMMQKRAFQVSDYTFTGLPQKTDELFESVSPPPAPPSPAKPAETKPVDPKKG